MMRVFWVVIILICAFLKIIDSVISKTNIEQKNIEKQNKKLHNKLSFEEEQEIIKTNKKLREEDRESNLNQFKKLNR